VTLNNHVHAAVCVTITVYSLTRCLSSAPEQGSRGAGMPCVPPAPPLLRSAAHFVLAGLFAALTFANELPALAFLALAALAALWCDWRKTLLYFAPPAI